MTEVTRLSSCFLPAFERTRGNVLQIVAQITSRQQLVHLRRRYPKFGICERWEFRDATVCCLWTVWALLCYVASSWHIHLQEVNGCNGFLYVSGLNLTLLSRHFLTHSFEESRGLQRLPKTCVWVSLCMPFALTFSFHPHQEVIVSWNLSPWSRRILNLLLRWVIMFTIRSEGFPTSLGYFWTLYKGINACFRFYTKMFNFKNLF